MAFLDFLSPIAMVVGSGLNAAANLIGGNKQAEAQREANATNYKMFQEQLGFTEDMWNKQNAYNTPAEQRKRYEEAGINPYLAMGNITGGNAESVTTPSPNAAVPAVGAGQGIAAAGSALGQGISMAAPQYLDTVSKREANRAAIIENAFRASRLTNDLVKQRRENDLLLSKKDLTDVERDNLLKHNDMLDEQLVQLSEYTKYIGRRALADTAKAENEADVAYYEAEYKRELARYQGLVANMFPQYQRAQINAFFAQAAQALSSSAFFDAQKDTEVLLRDEKLRGLINDNLDKAAHANGIRIDNEQKKAIMPYVIQQAQNEADAVELGPFKVKGNTFRRYLRKATTGTPASKSNYRLHTGMGKPLGK